MSLERQVGLTTQLREGRVMVEDTNIMSREENVLP
jgi:hypothetical protein